VDALQREVVHLEAHVAPLQQPPHQRHALRGEVRAVRALQVGELAHHVAGVRRAQRVCRRAEQLLGHRLRREAEPDALGGARGDLDGHQVLLHLDDDLARPGQLGRAGAEEVGDGRGDAGAVAARGAYQRAEEARVRVREVPLALDGHRDAQRLLDREGEAGGGLVAGLGRAHAVDVELVEDRRRLVAELGQRGAGAGEGDQRREERASRPGCGSHAAV